VGLWVPPLSLLDNGSNEELLEASFYMQSVSRERKRSDQSFPELLVILSILEALYSLTVPKNFVISVSIFSLPLLVTIHISALYKDIRLAKLYKMYDV
jgi:hypothetical protein